MASDPEQAVGTFWYFNLVWPVRLDPPPSGPAAFARVTVESAPALAQAMGLADAAEISQRLSGDCRCYAIWAAGALAAYGWVSFREAYIGELGIRLQLEPGEAYVWDCATLPTFRGRHYYTALLNFILQALQGEGLDRVWIGADADNAISLRGIARSGFVWVSELYFDRSGAKGLRGRPGVAQALVDASRRLLLRESA